MPPRKNWMNAGETPADDCRCGSWKQHWMNFSRHDWPETCSVSGCSKRATFAGHVVNPEAEGEYVLPLCAVCIVRQSPFALKPDAEVVPANRIITCGE